jgi:hypothetical protein
MERPSLLFLAAFRRAASNRRRWMIAAHASPAAEALELTSDSVPRGTENRTGVYCFPPNKGNIGTAADLDVFASVHDILAQLQKDGYRVSVPESS